MATAEAAATLDPAFARNVEARRLVQPADLRPSDITARLGAPWIAATDIVAFVKETMDADITIHHTPELAWWTVNAADWGMAVADGYGFLTGGKWWVVIFNSAAIVSLVMATNLIAQGMGAFENVDG